MSANPNCYFGDHDGSPCLACGDVAPPTQETDPE